ncbi:MAG: LysR family transcriptional regulator [Acidobacteria bacterium]|nr:LysR family transcriptional regulator [Acidobacteriota bacterium]MBW4045049.1 LysR family transcriptional regulator [Acidobacteriota bacterium]
MDITQLETFLAIVQERGFSRAALRLRRTQPAVSQTIRKLEEELGEQLFERTSRDGTLTSAGEVLRDYAERLLRLRNEAASAVEELRSLERGRLLLAANEYTCLYLLPVLDQFRRTCPQISVVVQRSLASRIPEDLLTRTVEMGIVSFAPETEQLRSISVYLDEVVFVVNPAHPLAREKKVAIRDLGAQSFIAHNVLSPLRKRVTETFEKHKTPLNMGVQLPSLEAVKRFVAMGNGVALVPGLTVAQEVSRGELVKVEVPELKIERRLRLVHRRHSPLSHAARAFLKLVKTMAQEQGSPFEYRVEHAN